MSCLYPRIFKAHIRKPTLHNAYNHIRSFSQSTFYGLQNFHYLSLRAESFSPYKYADFRSK